MITGGIDIGSRATKIVIFDREKGEIVGTAVADTRLHDEEHARGLCGAALRAAGITEQDVASFIATGYGRELISFAGGTVTEITAHARGVRHKVPPARTIIEIGGQDSKITKLDEKGSLVDFAMNDRCAAGTGRFLESVARIMAVDMAAIDAMVAGAKGCAAVSSTCVVFAESEIIGLLSQRVPREDIVCGVLRSIAVRVKGLLGKSLAEPVVFTGGVALVPGMAKALEREFGMPVTVSPDPQFTGALGAALIAAEKR